MSANKESRLTFKPLRALKIFSSLPDPAVAKIAQSTCVVHLEAGQRLKRPAGQEPELYYFVVAGQVAVILGHSEKKDTPGPGANGERGGPLEYLFFFTAEDFFSDAYLGGRDHSPGDRIDLGSVTESLKGLLVLLQYQAFIDPGIVYHLGHARLVYRYRG